jgi:hypothetical protein
MPNAIEELIGADVTSTYQVPASTGGPSTDPQGDAVARIELSFTIVAESYSTLADYVDGEMADKATIAVDKSEEETNVRRAIYTHLHHYLSALYSYNEQVQTFVNEHVSSGDEIPDRAISPREGDDPPNGYIAELAYLYGLRHGLQHGDYQFLEFKQVGEYNNEDFTFHELKFKVPAFQNSSVDYPQNHLSFTSQAAGDHNRPLCYIYEFNNEFGDFHTDLIHWIEQDP